MIRLLNNGDKDQTLQYTERNHIETTFLIGNILSFGLENDHNTRRCADYYGYFEKSELKGILPFYNLGSCIPHYESIAAIEEFSSLMKTRNFDYLIGMKKIVQPIYDYIKDTKIELHYSDSSYFINNNFAPFYIEGVELIDAGSVPLEIAEDFLSETIKTGFNAIKDVKQLPKLLSERSSEEDFLFLLEDGQIKAQANIQTYTSRINQIGAVYTSEKERGKGFCKAVVSELCRKIIDRGKIPTLSVRKNNTPAVRAYGSLGFTHYDDYLLINLK